MLLSIILIFFLQNPIEGEVIPIEAFGIHGDLTPTLFDEPLPEVFFTRSQGRSFAKREDFTGYLDLDAVRNRWFAGFQGKRVLMEVSHPGGGFAHLVLSAERSDGHTDNFVVEIPPMKYGDLVLDLSSLQDYATLYLVSLRNPDLWLRVETEDHRAVLREPIVLAPPTSLRNHFDGSDLCRPLERLMKVVNAFTGDYVVATVKRTQTNDEGYCSGPNGPTDGTDWRIDVFWPTSNDLFHKGNGSNKACSEARCCLTRTCLPFMETSCVPDCSSFTYATTNVAAIEPNGEPSGNILRWYHINGLENPPTAYDGLVDRVIFEDHCGVIRCHNSNPGGVDCSTNDQRIRWYVFGDDIANPCPITLNDIVTGN
jgi:hypothetical protein